jgi:hypothetical protein
MPRRALSPELLQEIRDRAAGWGKIVARAAAAGLTEGALGTTLEQQARARAGDQPCPACGAPCPVRRAPRALATPGASVTPNEPVGHCPAGRRDFFPPAPPAAPG